MVGEYKNRCVRIGASASSSGGIRDGRSGREASATDADRKTSATECEFGFVAILVHTVLMSSQTWTEGRFAPCLRLRLARRLAEQLRLFQRLVTCSVDQTGEYDVAARPTRDVLFFASRFL